jgi:hypothetical protein
MSYPFLEQDILRIQYPIFRDFKISYPYPILYPFSAFSAQDFGFQRQDFSFSTAVSAISAVICHFLAALLIDQGFNSIR